MKAGMKHDETLSLRLPAPLRSFLERQQRRMSKAAGAEVKLSAVARAILERAHRNERAMTRRIKGGVITSANA